ncbi:retention module-containing protein, partial [uncultured Oxalicibacterium sp.]|uniref:retention module-containing protein n=1 Tax=uncultured Oxalicibacterium sp. TaxID=1168540 RepID=UPI0025F41CBC
MARSETVVGKVVALKGDVFVRLEDGTMIRLKLGDEVREGDVIVTASGASVELGFPDNHTYAVRENEVVTLDASVIGNEIDSRNAALVARVNENVDIQNVIAQGGSLDELLEETEAGIGGGGGDAGHTFVMLDRIVEAVAPLNFAFGTTDRTTIPEFRYAQGSQVTSSTVSTPTVVGVSSDAQTEGTNLSHTVTLSAATTTTTTYAFTLAGNTASASDFGAPTFSNGVTYDSVAGTISVPAGVTSFTVTIPTINDNIHEANETLDLSVGGVAAVGTILDNDAVPTIGSIGSPSTTEGGDLTYAVTLTNPSSTSTTYPFTLGGGTAGSGDFGTPTFTNGVT